VLGRAYRFTSDRALHDREIFYNARSWLFIPQLNRGAELLSSFDSNPYVDEYNRLQECLAERLENISTVLRTHGASSRIQELCKWIDEGFEFAEYAYHVELQSIDCAATHNTQVTRWKTGEIVTPELAIETCKRQLQSLTKWAALVNTLTAPIPLGGFGEDRHLLLNHLIEVKDLRKRLERERNIKAASTFLLPSRPKDEARTVANVVAAKAIAVNRELIAKWLSNTNRNRRIVLPPFDAGEKVGVTLRRGELHAHFTSNVTIVLIHDPDSEVGYHIKTGFID
jgi:CDI toxin RNase A-like protein